jgi:hypothetical protein
MGRRKEWRSLSGSTFFGLTPEYRLDVFNVIHNIVFHGKGGFDWHTVYNMPIWLRNFTYRNIQEFYQKEKEAYEKAQGKSQLKGNQPKGPAIRTPSYNTKARK